MSTNSRSKINPRKKYPESSNKECKEKISIAKEEPCQNNNENAFASGQQQPRENNSEMKTDRIKADSEPVTKAADNDVMIGNKNAYNLQHSNTACNDSKINQDAAKDILLQLEAIKKQRCKKAEIINLDKENTNGPKNDFPPNTNIESRTVENDPIKINEKSQDLENKKADKNINEKIVNGHVKRDEIDKNGKNKVPENLKINNASIRKTEEAHTNSVSSSNNVSTPPQPSLFDLPSVVPSNKCLDGLEKDYDTNTIKEELMNLKEELKRQIVENRTTNADNDTSNISNGEKCIISDTPIKPQNDLKTADPDENINRTEDPIKTTSTSKAKKKKVKGKLTRSKKKESTPGRELPSEIPIEAPLPASSDSKPETPTLPDSISCDVEKIDDFEINKSISLKISNEEKIGQSEPILTQQPCDITSINAKAVSGTIQEAKIDISLVTINDTKVEEVQSQKDVRHENVIQKHDNPTIHTKDDMLPEKSLKTEETKFCEDLISQFIQTEIVQNGTSSPLVTDKTTKNDALSSKLDDKEPSDVNKSQNDMTQQNIPIIPPTPVKVSNFVQQAEKDSGSTLQRPSAFQPRRNSTASHGNSPKLTRQGKSLDEDVSDHAVEVSNYKTTRSKSMATVDFGGIQNPNRVPARWQGVQINSFSHSSSKFGGTISEESEQKPVITNPPRKSYSPIRENIPSASDLKMASISNFTARQEESYTKPPTQPNLGKLRHPLSRIEADTKDTDERMYSAEQKEQRNTGISPATAYQQYTFARSKTSLHLNTYGGSNQANYSTINNDTDHYRNKTMSPPPKLEPKHDSKIPSRLLKRMQHSANSANDKLPPSAASQTVTSGTAKSNVSINPFQPEKYVPSPQESALSAKIKQAKEEHSNACKDAKSFEKYERFNTVPTISTSPPQR